MGKSEAAPAKVQINRAEVVTLTVLMAGVWWGWDTPFLLPLKILVVFFHELSHGLMAIVTGGEIVEIAVVEQQGGLCRTIDGNRFLILSAGYLGSLCWGGLLLVLAARTRIDRIVSVLVGLVLVGSTVVWVRPVGSFGYLFGTGVGIALVAVGHFLSSRINDFLLRIIGLTSCLYAILDIKSDILDRPELISDATMLSQEFGLPTIFWGTLWVIIAIVASFWFLLISCRHTPRKKDPES